MLSDFAAFILTHGRPGRVLTYKTLRRCGYTGRIVLLVDNEDKALPEYRERYGDEVVVFDKGEVARRTDCMDNFPGRGTVLYARNATFDVAKRLGVSAFVQLDDDYSRFERRFTPKHVYIESDILITNLDRVFAAIVRFLRKTSSVSSLAMAQGGDYTGGRRGTKAESISLWRKAMNSFFCLTDRPFEFLGRMNDDVNTYVRYGAVGGLFFTTNHVSLKQGVTQQSAGGLTEMYLEHGTYVKSFYTVMLAPSAVHVGKLGPVHARLHHSISVRHAYPLILSQEFGSKR